MSEMAKITPEMSDDAFRSLVEATLRGQSREVQKPLAKRPEPRARKAVVLPAGNVDLTDAAIERIGARTSRLADAALGDAKARSRAAMPKTETREVRVESPYGRVTNGFDKVERVIDTIDWMLRKHMIDRDQEAAARMVQNAWAAAPGAIRCALSAGEGGSGPGSRSITSQQEWAGGVLNDVRKELGRLDSLVVVRICGLGMSIEQTARMVFAVPESAKVKQHETLHVGMRLRMGLAVLAKLWRVKASRPRVGKGSANHRSATSVIDGYTLNGPAIGALSESEREDIALSRVAIQPKRRVKRGKKNGASSR